MSFKILRIDVVLAVDSTPKPIVFFKPDYIALDYLMINNPTMVKISGTDLYDGEYLGTLDKSNLDKGMYGVAIDTVWKGYPDPEYGSPKIEIIGVKLKEIEDKGDKKGGGEKMKSGLVRGEAGSSESGGTSDQTLVFIGLFIIGLSIYAMSGKE
jgi:hypothetical protein